MEKTPFDEEIKTERLVLKRHRTTFDYAIMWYKLIEENKPFLTRFLEHFADITTPEQEYEYFLSSDKACTDMTKMSYALWTREGDLIGSCDTPELDFKRQEAEIGYLLAEKYTGHGYMTEAVKALEDNLFKRGFHRLTIIMDSENKASENVAIRRGFKKEGVMHGWRYNTTLQSWRDMYLYAKLKEEWERE